MTYEAKAVSETELWRVDYVAQKFHEAYEALAPMYGYTTRSESSVPWEQVPDANKMLMRAVVTQLLSRSVIECYLYPPRKQPASGPSKEVEGEA